MTTPHEQEADDCQICEGKTASLVETVDPYEYKGTTYEVKGRAIHCSNCGAVYADQDCNQFNIDQAIKIERKAQQGKGE